MENKTVNNKQADTFFKAPEQRRKRRSKAASEYGKSLREKQTLKRLYNLSEKQFKAYVKHILDRRQKLENVSDELAKSLEKRLDNTVFRLGFAKSRKHARQIVSHGYFLVNGKPVNVPSFALEKGDVLALKESKKAKTLVKEVAPLLKKAKAPSWLNLDGENFKAEIVGEPTLAEVNFPVELSLIFEFYSR